MAKANKMVRDPNRKNQGMRILTRGRATTTYPFRKNKETGKMEPIPGLTQRTVA